MFESLMNKNFDDMSKETAQFRFDWFVKEILDYMDSYKELQVHVSHCDFFVMSSVEDLFNLMETHKSVCAAIDSELIVFAMFVLGIKDHIKFE